MIEIAAGLLWGDVGRGADDEAVEGLEAAEGIWWGVGNGGIEMGWRGGWGGVTCGDIFGEAPVHDEDLAEGADHDIFGFEVTMDHAFGVGVSDGIADLLEDGEEGSEGIFFEGFWVGMAEEVNDFVKGGAFDELHAVEHFALGVGAEFINGDDIGVFELAGELGFFDEAEGIFAGELVLGVDDFDGDRAAEAEVAGLEDDAHAAVIDGGDDLIFGAFDEFADIGEAEIFVPEGISELLSGGMVETDDEFGLADLDFLADADAGGDLEAEPIDEDAVAAGEIFDDEFEGGESEASVVAGDVFGVDENGAGEVASDEIFAVFDGKFGEFGGAEDDIDFRAERLWGWELGVGIEIGHWR